MARVLIVQGHGRSRADTAATLRAEGPDGPTLTASCAPAATGRLGKVGIGHDGGKPGSEDDEAASGWTNRPGSGGSA